MNLSAPKQTFATLAAGLSFVLLGFLPASAGEITSSPTGPASTPATTTAVGSVLQTNVPTQATNNISLLGNTANARQSGGFLFSLSGRAEISAVTLNVGSVREITGLPKSQIKLSFVEFTQYPSQHAPIVTLTETAPVANPAIAYTTIASETFTVPDGISWAVGDFITFRLARPIGLEKGGRYGVLLEFPSIGGRRTFNWRYATRPVPPGGGTFRISESFENGQPSSVTYLAAEASIYFNLEGRR